MLTKSSTGSLAVGGAHAPIRTLFGAGDIDRGGSGFDLRGRGQQRRDPIDRSEQFSFRYRQRIEIRRHIADHDCTIAEPTRQSSLCSPLLRARRFDAVVQFQQCGLSGEGIAYRFTDASR